MNNNEEDIIDGSATVIDEEKPEKTSKIEMVKKIGIPVVIDAGIFALGMLTGYGIHAKVCGNPPKDVIHMRF